MEAWVREHDPYSIREEDGPYLMLDPQGGPPTLMSNVTRTALVLHVSEPFPPDWSALIGDAVHNLRSALDHLALALNAKGYADANNGASLPRRNVKDSEFLVVGDTHPERPPADVFTGSLKKKIATMPSAARGIIEGIQPYKRRDSWATDPLWLIHDLDRIDKHRQLVLSTVATHRIDVSFFNIDGPHIESGIGLGKPLDDGGELAYWALLPEAQLAPGETPTKVEYDLDVSHRIAFGKGPPCAGWPVVETLRDLRDYVRVKVAFRLDRFL